ncbi:Nramp family divalent metal transporter [Acidaminococcus sp. NSJ-142]|mgnify:CR=1 FL=1|jgi:Mn2+/Fe2+ NRAMP family transporter|nr:MULTISPECIES: Nramp family divalent metal transporter [Acidaminococcus]MCD2435707.1 Nramp family divalent metal transporter [Acidaminococcus hominis]MCH4096650.1 Nramp family divalent metal transporter [Acidaminococcus provencensis]RHK02620.1 divalent metal cation transporter [Acidaminococcus sp. AM05-11]
MQTEAKKYTLSDKMKSLGPGFLIVGSFIGPGTVTSSTKAGADYGLSLFWCVIFSVIAVMVMQGMAARLGIVTQMGLAENLVKDFEDRPLLRNLLCGLVAVAITIGGFAYMSGDLTGTAIGISALTGVSTRIIAPIWGLCILLILSFAGDAVKYLEKLLGICVVIMAVVFLVTMIVVRPDVGDLLAGCVPNIPQGGLMTCLSLIGTTVVPYNMFLHAASAKRTWHSTDELPLCRFGTNIPMIIGGIVTGAIMVTSATVMYGMPVRNAMDMAVQLRPTLGVWAEPFMAIGLVAAGVSSAVCTPMGVSYVLAGLFKWKTDRSDKRYTITNFLVLITGIVVAGMGFNPIALIMAAQMVNGIVLPVVVGVTIYLTCRHGIMGQFVNSKLETVLGVGIFGISLVLGLSSVVSLM